MGKAVKNKSQFCGSNIVNYCIVTLKNGITYFGLSNKVNNRYYHIVFESDNIPYNFSDICRFMHKEGRNALESHLSPSVIFEKNKCTKKKICNPFNQPNHQVIHKTFHVIHMNVPKNYRYYKSNDFQYCFNCPRIHWKKKGHLKDFEFVSHVRFDYSMTSKYA